MLDFAVAASAEDARAPLLPNAAAPRRPKPWHPLTRAGFRIAFLYLMLFVFCYGNGSLFQIFGSVGGWIDGKLTWPLFRVAEFISVRILHFTGMGAKFHLTGSGDTRVQYVFEALLAALSIAGGLMWTAVAAARGNRRVEYQTLYAWLRFLLRLTLGMFMLGYGWTKLFPFQMAPISIAVLNEQVGNMSPMTMLWSLIGLHPVYEMICGSAEVLGGVLILFRRTALAGALVSAFVISNVLLYNLFFDVPVKLFSAHLLLALLFITLPDVPALYRFFWLHQPAAPVGIWVPPTSRRSFRITTRVIEIGFALGYLVMTPIQQGMGWRGQGKALRTPNPLMGAWRVETQQPAGAFDSPEHLAITELYVDAPNRAFSRSTDGELWRTWMQADPKEHTVNINVYVNPSVNFAVQTPDPNHAVLTAVVPKPDGKNADAVKHFKPMVLTLTRMPLPSHYPLLDRGFHWVNEWGLER